MWTEAEIRWAQAAMDDYEARGGFLPAPVATFGVRARGMFPFPSRSDRDGWLAAVSAEGYCLAHCPSRWIDDRDVASAAVRSDGLAIQYAHKNKRNDNDIRVEAVRQNPDAIG